MDPARPIIEIIRPDGQPWKNHHLTKDCTTIGRYSELNDIALQPDPQRYVTRKKHCSIERQGSNWYVVQHGKNALMVERDEEDLHLVQDKALLSDGSRIYIRGWSSETGTLQFWKLFFRDAEETQATDSVAYLDYEDISGQVVKSQTLRSS